MRRLVSILAAVAIATVAFITLGSGIASANHCAFISCHGYAGPDYYYADWGFDGAIHCGMGKGYIESYYNGDRNKILVLGTTYGKRDYYCANADYSPGSYLQARVTLYRDGLWCATSGWQASSSAWTDHETVSLGGWGWNGSDPLSSSFLQVSTGTDWGSSPRPIDIRNTQCNGPGNFYALVEHYSAINFGWRYGAEWTGVVQGG